MIKAILFDMVGPLLKKCPQYKLNPVVERAEELKSRNPNDKEYIEALKKDPVTKNAPIEQIVKRNVEKYCKIGKVWDELLPGLKANYKLAVINNGTVLTIPYFKKKNNFSRYFEVFVNSSEEGIEKPNPEIFKITCRRLGVKPEECVFIDDSEKNVIGAINIGMKGIVYRSYKDLVKDLEMTDIQLW